MPKIRDRVLLGAVSGVLAALPVKYLVNQESKWGLIGSNQRRLTGRFNSPAIGIATTYLLSITGTEGAFLKGAAVSTIAGFFPSRTRPYKAHNGSSRPWGSVVRLVNRAVYGGLCAALTVYLGHEDLFPQPKWPPVQRFSYEHPEEIQTYTIQNVPTYGGVPEGN